MTIGDRLRTERKRLGMSQADFAERLGAVKKSQTNYELGHSSPSAQYLAAAASLGVDVQYVLTGVPGATAPDEIRLVRLYRASSPEVQGAALRMLGGVPAPQHESAPSVAISGGTQGQVVAGDGKQEKLTINVQAQKKGRLK